MNLLAIDPGKATGWAYFDKETLVSCGVLKFNPHPEYFSFMEYRRFSKIIIEKPKIYPVRQWKGDPNDLISVALIAGWVAGFLDEVSSNIEYVTPQAWKGNRPKEVDHRHTMSLLSTEEKEVIKRTKGVLKSQKHNMIDAIGIGLWYLRRK
jgi:hypothetical protein